MDVINFAQNKATKCLQNENLIDKESASLLWSFIVLLCRQNGVRVSLLEHPFLSALVQGSLATRKVRQDFWARRSRPGRPPGSRSPAGHVAWGKGRFGLPIVGLPSMCRVPCCSQRGGSSSAPELV